MVQPSNNNNGGSDMDSLEDMLRKLSELEQRVLDAEGRAEEAEDKVRIMEQKLAWSQQSDSSTTTTTSGALVVRLEGEVEEQRALRLQDARQVEAKAARIKEWVTNKLKELELQNQTLREQNIKCNQQLELLKNHLALSDRRRSESVSPVELNKSGGGSNRHRRHQSGDFGAKAGSASSCGFGAKTSSASSCGFGPNANNAEAALTSHSLINSASSGGFGPNAHHALVTSHKQLANNSALVSASMDPLSEDLRLAVHNLTLANDVDIDSSRQLSDDGDLVHDYAEIYTPSREKVVWPRAPTPPLHRFPSWEDRIYQVAVEGLTVAGCALGDVGVEEAGYQDIPVPVYATVKGRASQIRAMPFTGESSDDSSDGEGNNTMAVDGTNTHSRSSGDTTGSSPGKRTASSSSGSPSKSKTRGVSDTSFESGMSDDYAVPPDALSCDTTSLESSLLLRASYLDSPKRAENLEKSGNLAKLGGKLKTWRKRWFVLKNGVLTYHKSQSDIHRKPQGQILLDDFCKITRAEGSNTFEIDTAKKTYYLTADSMTAMEDWVKVLQSVQRRNATKILLGKEENKVSVQGWLTKVKNGHAKKCWCVLIGKMFLYFKTPTDTTPAGQINMRDARVEEVEHLSDSDSEERDAETPDLTIGLFPTNQGPTYILCPGKQEKDAWLYHLTVASGGGPSSGSQYEQLIHKLMEVDGEASCVLWRHPVLLHVPCTKDGAIPSYFPLTTLSSESIQAEGIKLFKCLQLFMSAAVDQAGIDYHVVLAQNALQQCLDMPELQAELICALIKQTSKSAPLPKLGVQVSTQKLLKKGQLLLCATQSLFTCEATPSITSSSDQHIASSHIQAAQEDKYKEQKESASHKESHKDSKGPPTYTLLQGWQLLALAVSLFVPKLSRLLWFLKLHLARNADTRTECGKYASYCERALERTILMGGRELKPSRMEVLSILMKNPQHHSLPHSMPVHLLNGTYHISSFDGSTTIKEFQHSFSHEIGCRITNGFALFSDDPIEKDLEHTLDPNAKLCDLISKWEIALREKGLGKFENSKVIRLTYKNRLWWKNCAKLETDKERVLLCYQINKQIITGRFPLSRELALELASLMAQLDVGDCANCKAKSANATLCNQQSGLSNQQNTLHALNSAQSANATLCNQQSGFIQGSHALNAPKDAQSANATLCNQQSGLNALKHAQSALCNQQSNASFVQTSHASLCNQQSGLNALKNVQSANATLCNQQNNAAFVQTSHASLCNQQSGLNALKNAQSALCNQQSNASFVQTSHTINPSLCNQQSSFIQTSHALKDAQSANATLCNQQSSLNAMKNVQSGNASLCNQQNSSNFVQTSHTLNPSVCNQQNNATSFVQTSHALSNASFVQTSHPSVFNQQSNATTFVQNSHTLNALNNVNNALMVVSNQALSAIDRFYPYRYRDQLTPEGLVELQGKLLDKWRGLKGRTPLDCVRIYLTCTRKWAYFGATLFQARLRQHDSPMIWLAVSEDAITVLDLATMQQRVRYTYTSVLTFGGCQQDFMLVVTHLNDSSQKLIFSMSKPKILELTLLIADYMNLLINNPSTPLLGTLSRGTMVSVNQSMISQTIANQSQPDILKSTPDHGGVVQRVDSKRRTHVDSGLA